MSYIFVYVYCNIKCMPDFVCYINQEYYSSVGFGYIVAMGC